MHPLVEPVAPGSRLLIQLIDIGKMYARPEAEFDDAYAALDLALRLWRPRLADTRSDAQTGHEVTKHRVPFGRLVLHLQQKDALHTIGEGRFG